MKFRVQNMVTGNFVSEPVTQFEADRICESLNWSGKKYKSVPVELETKNLSPVLKPMSEDVKEAIKNLDKITYAPGTNHSVFANAMIKRFNEKKYEISEKEEAYLWYIVHRYRRQVEDQKLISVAIQNKIY